LRVRIAIQDLAKMKRAGERIAMLTAYDYPSARIAERAGLPVVLVGDSLGMVVQGRPPWASRWTTWSAMPPRWCAGASGPWWSPTCRS
jgi:hypothetical protein